MPTGYTAAVVDGRVTEFPAFAMSCARAFGALVTMRDDPSDAVIPDEIVPSPYYANRLEGLQVRLKELKGLTPEQVETAASEAHEKACQCYADSERERLEANARIEAMSAKVSAWEPPSPDHQEMKSFMLQQLSISISDSYSKPPEKLLAWEWLAREVSQTLNEINSSIKHHAEEVERAQGRTQWIKQLRASLEVV